MWLQDKTMQEIVAHVGRQVSPVQHVVHTCFLDDMECLYPPTHIVEDSQSDDEVKSDESHQSDIVE